MAKMTVTAYEPEPPPPVYTLEMTKEEAQLLYDILGHFDVWGNELMSLRRAFELHQFHNQGSTHGMQFFPWSGTPYKL